MVVLALYGWVATGLPVAGVDARPRDQVEARQPQRIHVKANKVIADLDGGEARFMGNVRVTQGSTTVTSDQMDVFYKNDDDNKSETEVKATIKKIVATGNVKIHLEDLTAFTDKAEYVAETEILTMTGSNSRVISGENSISGSMFIVSRADGEIIVEGSEQDQIQAVIFPGQTGLF
jgi:lipopolysaccharide export system protein LptA